MSEPNAQFSCHTLIYAFGALSKAWWYREN